MPSSPIAPSTDLPWLQPQWPAPSNVHAACTTRAGGASLAPWGSLNLGDHVGDLHAHVVRNRQRLLQSIQQVSPQACSVYLQQVHGVNVVTLNEKSPQGQAADACVTNTAGVVCTIMVADCLPVLFAHDSGLVVAAAHAGWRGLVGLPPGRVQAPLAEGVLEQTFKHFCAQVLATKAQPAINFINEEQGRRAIAAHTLVWLGPCIGPGAFEVGAEVRQAFMSAQAGAADCFQPGPTGKYYADLAALARQRLPFMATTAARPGAPSTTRHSSSRTGAMRSPWVAAVVLPPASGLTSRACSDFTAGFSACPSRWNVPRLRLRRGTMYSSKPTGSRA